MEREYDSSSIEVLEGLDPVKKRPGMYTDTKNPNHIVQEIIDNSVDEAMGGYANQIRIVIGNDNSVTVEDNGRGLPTDKNNSKNVSGAELIFCQLHAGGKFSGKQYEYAGGLHGVGASVTNALSKRMEVEIYRNGNIYSLIMENGTPLEGLNEIGKSLRETTGTKVKFWPDESYFDSPKINIKSLKQLSEIKAVLCENLEIEFINENNEEDNEIWKYKKGIVEYFEKNVDIEEVIPSKPTPIVFELEEDGFKIGVVMAWQTEGNVFNESYVNLIPTVQGGTHVNGLRTGTAEAVRDFAEHHNLLPKNLKIAPDDVFSNVSFVLSILMRDPQFAGQTKERLSSRDVANKVNSMTKDHLILWLNEHMDIAKEIVNIAIDNANNRLKKSKQVKRKKVTQGPALPGKLADCKSNDLDMTELFLVEGDSAGGSAKQARNRDTQAILPLRGKILNAWEVDSDQILSSDEINNISIAIGIDPNNDDLSGLRYGKVCVLADADSDGLHIATLLCALFLKHFRKLVDNGHVFIAMPPLYRVDYGKETHYALDENEKNNLVNKLNKKGNAKISVTRFKGLGEMNPDQLSETTMDPDTRRLVQLRIGDNEKTEDMFNMLFGKKNSAMRQNWLSRDSGEE